MERTIHGEAKEKQGKDDYPTTRTSDGASCFERTADSGGGNFGQGNGY
jgi:hypothetical protein